MAGISPTDRSDAKNWGGAYRANDETDRRLTESYTNLMNKKLNPTEEDLKEKERLAQEIKDYRKQRAENENAPRPTSAQTTDETIEPKMKKKKVALGAMVKAKDRDTILSSTIKADRDTLG